MAQLPEEAIGDVVVALLFAAIALLCMIIMLWLTWRHERFSYVALISWFLILTTVTGTVAQQIEYIFSFRDISNAYHIRAQANLHSENPRLWIALTFGMVGYDLVAFWLMMGGYDIQALLVLFWAMELAYSVFGIPGKPGSKVHKAHQLVLKYGKAFSIVLPILDILLLQIPAVQNNDMAWFILTNSILLVCVILSIIVVGAIFVKYVGYRNKVKRMSCSTQGTRSRQTSLTANTENAHGLYDRWLLPRFGLIIVFLTFFELFNIAIQVNNWQLMLRQKNEPDSFEGDAGEGVSYLILTTIPKNLPCIAVLLIFGTTRVFRARLYRTFWPKRWQRYDKDTPLETPYQSAQSGRKWFATAPRIDVNFTTASLRWEHADKTFAAWESRPLGSQATEHSDEESQKSPTGIMH